VRTSYLKISELARRVRPHHLVVFVLHYAANATHRGKLRPGETLQLTFEVHFEPHGFSNSGVDAFVVANGTYFTNLNWLPAIGYQPNRELNAAGVRRQYGLTACSLSVDSVFRQRDDG
jgi:hypothetical protein